MPHASPYLGHLVIPVDTTRPSLLENNLGGCLAVQPDRVA